MVIDNTKQLIGFQKRKIKIKMVCGRVIEIPIEIQLYEDTMGSHLYRSYYVKQDLIEFGIGDNSYIFSHDLCRSYDGVIIKFMDIIFENAGLTIRKDFDNFEYLLKGNIAEITIDRMK